MRHLICCIILLAFMVADIATAQSGPIAPPSLSRYVDQSNLSQSDMASIRAFVEREAPRLASTDPAEAVQARSKLLNDLSGTRRVSPMFREQYTEVLEPHLRSALDGDNISAAVMAAQIASMLGTDGAVKILTDRLETRDEPRQAVRVWAAGGLGMLANAPTVSERRMTRALRSLAVAASEEPSWAVRRRAMMSLAAAVANERGDDAGQDAVREEAIERLGETMQETLRSIRTGDTQFMIALPPATTQVQNALLMANSPQQQAVYAEHLVPVLAGAHEAILESWDTIRSDPRSLAAAARFLDESELLLSVLTNTPQRNAQLSKAIMNGQRGPVQQAAEHWNPYRG